MSAATEIAEREAEEAEREFPDAQEPETADAAELDSSDVIDIGNAPVLEDEPAVPAQPTASDLDEVYKQIERKADNYKRDMARLLGKTGAPWQESPFDQVPGYLLPFNPDAPEALVMKQAADAYFLAGKRKRQPHPTFVTCPPCDGEGKMDNGAKGDCTDWVPCWSCHGSGTRDLTMPPPSPPVAYQPLPTPQTAPNPYAPPAAPQNGSQGAERLDPPAGWHQSGAPGADQWARWPGHPRYGIDPSLSGW